MGKNTSKKNDVKTDVQKEQKNEKIEIVDKAIEKIESHKNKILVGCGVAAAAIGGFVLGHFVLSSKPSGGYDTIVAATLDGGYDSDDDDDEFDSDEDEDED